MPAKKRSPAKRRRAPDPGTAESPGDKQEDSLSLFHPVTAAWFRSAIGEPTAPQRLGWPAIARGQSTLILAPTGSGKTLAAFLWCLDRLMLRHDKESEEGCRVLYVSPLKALAVDVERNLQRPLAGIAAAAADAAVPVHLPGIAIRTGDTSPKERGRFRRHPAEILVTTPESLYLLLTSGAAAGLRSVDTVIVDEIHALAPTKRGAHLALSLERLEAISTQPIQRIGLSATQRPLEEIAHFLAGAESPDSESTAAEPPPAEESVRFRPVTIVDSGERKKLELRIEVAVEDMARLDRQTPGQNGAAPAGPKRTSIWGAIHGRLVELVRENRSTIVFVNSRRIAERLAGAMNDLAGCQLARAHHGSLAAAQRSEIETLLKDGQLRALVATSSLELGIDMGAVDLVVQIEAPPSVASAMQRIGRAGHQAGASSRGILIPKYRADLVACAAVTRAMHEGLVESTRFPRNPLDILAQQIVAIVAHPPALAEPLRGSNRPNPQPETGVDELFRLVRRSAPFSTLSRASFLSVLDLLAGRYPSDEFADLRPRLTWDRARNTLTPREGSKLLAVLNGGAIPDRGLYGVFLSGEHGKAIRVGELDEEMVFESRTGDRFILGASTWRIDEISHDRVLVSAAPGQPGKMPFWHGDAAGRPIELGRRIGKLAREVSEMPHNAALSRLVREHDLAPGAAENLIRFLADQRLATVTVPSDRSIVVERTHDEQGDWRICVLTPFGSRVHAPWAMAIGGLIGAIGGPDVEPMWGDDGFVLRFSDLEAPPSTDFLLLDPDRAGDLVMRQLGGTALFAAKFREIAGRALLLPRRRARGRAPLWQQRKRASDLLKVAARYPSFPLLLEAYRECIRDVFDLPALVETLRAIRDGELRVHVADTRTPSPFAASLLFSYVANYIYDGDAPLAERRAQALTIDQEQLRELLGEADLRELLDSDAIAEVEEQLQCLTQAQRIRSADGIHDLLLRLGDLSRAELERRFASPRVASGLPRLLDERRLIEIEIAGEPRLAAVEDAARYRDALQLKLPGGIPPALLEPVAAPLLELVRRYARTHGPFTLREIAGRFSLSDRAVEAALHTLLLDGRIVEGGFRPAGVYREWCNIEVLGSIRRKSLARLRREVEPVQPKTLARFATHWQGVLQRRRGLDALLDSIEHLEGAPLPASLVESSILPARLAKYAAADLDTLIAAGEVVWCGLDPLGERDGRIALFLAEHFASRLPAGIAPPAPPAAGREAVLLQYLGHNGASFFHALHEASGGGYPGETLDALWRLVWRGQVTNDTFHALRAYVARPPASRPAKRQHNQPSFRSRRTTPPSAQGRWTLVPSPSLSAAEWSHAAAQRLLHRYGILTRESAENLPGGFSAIYEVLKALEEHGGIRRGYFVAGLGAAQFALPPAVDLLRSLRNEPQPESPEMVLLAATDPANLYGSVLGWPPGEEAHEGSPRAMTRSVGASVILRNGEMVAYLRRSNPHLLAFLPGDEPERAIAARDLSHFLAASARGERRPDEEHWIGMLIATVNGQAAFGSYLARFLEEAGFRPAPLGYNLPRPPVPAE